MECGFPAIFTIFWKALSRFRLRFRNSRCKNHGVSLREKMVVMQFGFRAELVEREIPFDRFRSLRAGSSLRLKNGYVQDDAAIKKAKLIEYRKNFLLGSCTKFGHPPVDVLHSIENTGLASACF